MKVIPVPDSGVFHEVMIQIRRELDATGGSLVMTSGDDVLFVIVSKAEFVQTLKEGLGRHLIREKPTVGEVPSEPAEFDERGEGKPDDDVD